MSEEKEKQLIAGRIMDEYRKHSTGLPEQWHEVAASKIHSQFKEYYSNKLNDKDNIIDDLLECVEHLAKPQIRFFLKENEIQKIINTILKTQQHYGIKPQV